VTIGDAVKVAKIPPPLIAQVPKVSENVNHVLRDSLPVIVSIAP
jgi:hypothetical protein